MDRRRLRQTIGMVAVAAAAIVLAPPGLGVAQAAPSATADVDGDHIANVEERVCGSQTCADGSEDRGGDGISDWVEAQACERGTTCADASEDDDRDGVPDFASTTPSSSSSP